jgi:ATP-binding cassette, subfamily B (MDR/TAP), member 1
MKRWRANKTTIVITHDLSQICSNDFVYVLQSGRVAEQGYRYDLEGSPGEFRRMLDAQGLTGGFLPTKNLDVDPLKDVQAILDGDLELVDDLNLSDPESNRLRPFPFGDGVLSPSAPRLTFGNWMFDVVADLTIQADNSTHAHQDEEIVHTEVRPRRPSSIHIVPVPSPTVAPMSRPHSLQFSPTSPTFALDDLSQFVYDKEVMMEPTTSVNARRRLRQERARWDDKQSVTAPTALERAKDLQHLTEATPTRPPSLLNLLTEIYPLVPYKFLILLGLLVCLASGAMTPIFSYLLSRLLFEVSIGAGNTGIINTFGGIVLGVAALDGITHGLKYFIMEISGTFWVSHIRRTAFKFILMQDKKWFDKSDHSAVKLVQTIIKDGDDARNLISVVLGQSVVVLTMLLVGLIWALVRGWQLTLVGFAIAPIFAATMAIQSKLVAQCEARNKASREDVANNYFEVSVSSYASMNSVFICSLGDL